MLLEKRREIRSANLFIVFSRCQTEEIILSVRKEPCVSLGQCSKGQEAVSLCMCLCLCACEKNGFQRSCSACHLGRVCRLKVIKAS